MEDDELEKERQALITEHAELEAEHARMRERPRDIHGHFVHSARLHDHAARLHALIEQLRVKVAHE